jgi:hypothetical protein
VERLTSEQIRLLEELRELRDSGILTVDEFEVQVAKVLGRPLIVEPLPVDEELSVPEDTQVAEFLEYEFVEPETSDENGILAEENQVIEPLPISESPASALVESEPQQSNSSRRKVLIGTTVGLVLAAVIVLVTLVGGGKSDTAFSEIVDSTTTVTQSTVAANSQAPVTSSQSAVITTTVTQNASTGTANRPTTPSTTAVNIVNSEPVVTALRLTQSPPVFYDTMPGELGLQPTVTFTASISNDEQPGVEFRLLRKSPLGWGWTGQMFQQVQPGIWKLTISEGGNVGLNEYCVSKDSFSAYYECTGPTASFEVLVQERNPPIISDVNISPAVVNVGDTVRVSARIVDATGVNFVIGYMGVLQVGQGGSGASQGCGEFSLDSGDSKDGLWSFECVLISQAGQATVSISAGGIYSEQTNFSYRFEVL